MRDIHLTLSVRLETRHACGHIGSYSMTLDPLDSDEGKLSFVLADVAADLIEHKQIKEAARCPRCMAKLPMEDDK
jgi:hypothetical protein